jgi:Mg-chelatase subunit ChlD
LLAKSSLRAKLRTNQIGPDMLRIIIFICLFTVLGCKNEEPSQPPPIDNSKKIITLNIIYDNDLSLGQWFSSIVTEYQDARNQVDSKQQIKINLQQRSISVALEEIADGRIKADAVLLPDPGFARIIDLNIRNLGAGVRDCKTLIESPYVAVIPRSYAEIVANTLAVSIDPATTETVVLPLAKIAELLRISRFGLVHPKRSARGNFGLIFAINSVAPQFSSGQITWEEALNSAAPLKENFDWFAPSDIQLLRRLKLANASSSREIPIPLGIVSERQLKLDPLLTNEVIAIKATEQIVKEKHSLCISSADWVNPQKDHLLKELQSVLATEASITRAIASGFTAATSTAEDTTFAIKSPEVLLSANLANFFDKERALAVAIDTSASMEQKDLDVLRNFALDLTAKLKPEDLDILTFSSDISVLTESNNNANLIKDSLLALKPSGGSAIYDAVFKQYKMLQSPDRNNKRKIALLISDGGDKNSLRKIQDLINMARASGVNTSETYNNFVSLHVVGINNGSGELDNLKLLAEAAAGSYYEVTSDSLAELFMEIESLLQ